MIAFDLRLSLKGLLLFNELCTALQKKIGFLLLNCGGDYLISPFNV